ncbi:MAG: tetratricopeptide repeat protein [Bacteroidetes bacterium]|nr:tetratricopeptide repeat protein [Bacteroidota bacterium]
MNGISSNRNMINIRSVFLYILLLNLLVQPASAQNERKNLREGNRNYSAGKFGDSELSYRRATEVPRGTPDAWFNLGNSIYRQQRFDDAAASFEKNISLDDDAIKRSNAYYNIGNSGLSAGRYEESIEAYKRSLKMNPSNLEAKYNLAYAQDMLKEQQQQQQQEDRDQNKENKENKENKDNKNKEDHNEEENPDEQKEQQENRDNQSDGQQQKQENESQSGLTQEDARRLLEALAENEKQIQEKVKKDKASAAMVRTLKNW